MHGKKRGEGVTDEEFEKAVLVIDMVNRGNIQDLMAKDAMGILEDLEFLVRDLLIVPFFLPNSSHNFCHCCDCAFHI
jgi:hypothetical protein